MLHRLKKEAIVYILIFCLNQIIVAGVNPFGIALAISSISMGYKILPIIIVTLVGNALIYANNLVANMLTIIIFVLFQYIIEKRYKKINYIIKAIIFLIIYSLVRIYFSYQDLFFLNGIILILEIIITITSYLVFSVGISYIVKKDITKEMNIQEKISVSLIITLLGIYIIQVRDDNVTPLKIVIIYLLSFVGTLTYKAIINVKRDRSFKYGQVYNNLVYNKLSEYALAVKKMSKSINMMSNDENKLSYEQGNIIFEKISQKYCANCDRCNYCWDREFETTYEAANMMMAIGIENGVLTLKDIPKSFMIRCKKGKEIIETTNINLEIARNNIWWQHKVNEMKYIMSMQLKELSSSINNFSLNMYKNISLDNKVERQIRYVLKRIGILVKDIYCYEHKGVKEIIMTVKTHGNNVKSSEIAEEISDLLCERYKVGEFTPRLINGKIVEINLIKEEEYKIVSAFCGMKKENENYCGDNYSVMEEDISDTVFILSDGMGCGKEAYKESKRTVEMIEELLTVGFSKDIAVNLVNSSMYINCENNKYATLDICIFNRYNGICDFIKVGAMPTFIKRGSEVIEIESDTLPVGIFTNTEYKDETINLCDGDIIIMLTDGLTDSMPTYIDWKEELIYIIKNIDVYNPNVIAQYIIEQAISGSEVIDDISVLVGVVWKNNTI